MNFENDISRIIEDNTEFRNVVVKKQKKDGFGDYSIVLFPLMKSSGKKVNEIADLIKSCLESTHYISECQFLNGFLNIVIKKTSLVSSMWENIRSSAGGNETSQNSRVIIDYSSPNIAKPFSIGHLRSTIIGNILGNIYEALGYEVVRVNHLGDWGTQFGKVIVAIRKWGEKSRIENDPVRELLSLYVRFHEEAEKDSVLEDEAREAFRKLEQKDPEYFELWQYIVKVSIDNIEKIYKRLGVRFDKYMGESFYEPLMDETMNRLEKAGLVSESEGAWVVELEKDSPPCLLRKKDGASLYALRDVTALLFRVEKMCGSKLLYVVGNEQKLHFNQVFRVCEKLDGKFLGIAEHIGFGLYKFKDTKMSTRKGNVIFMEDVLDEACAKVAEIMKDRGFEKEELENISEKVGTGAVIFNDISSDRNKDVDFSWDKVLDLNGETAPYVQYTAVRIKSILSKAGFVPGEIRKPDLHFDEYEDTLRHLEDFRGMLERACEKNQPYIVSQYIIELCGHFNGFYSKVRILSENKSERDSHLEFINVILIFIQKGLDILGIKIPEKM